MPYKMPETTTDPSTVADTTPSKDILNDASSHRRQWTDLFDDKIAAAEGDDVSYWEHEKRAFLRLMNHAAALHDGLKRPQSMPHGSRAHPATSIDISPESRFSYSYDAEELEQFLEDNGVHPSQIERDSTVTGYKVTIRSSALEAQSHIDLLGAFEAMKKAEAKPAQRQTTDVAP